MSTLQKVREIIAGSLYLDDIEMVRPESRLIADLGAESIDFLDIIFQLEETFAVRIPKGEIERLAREGLTDEEFAINGVLQAKGLARISAIMSEIDPAAFTPGLKLHDIPSLYTVQTFATLVDNRRAAGSAVAAPAAAEVPAELTKPAVVGSQVLA